MSTFAIRTSKLGKRYRLGTLSQQTYTGYDILGFDLPLQRLWPIIFGDPIDQPSPNDFWALRDLDLEVKPGEVVGVIGKNGSGKSTLLKILARVTEPSTGYADVHGQVGSLLEVGTGFHPELTGRQNVYLNGSIMGMTHAQIDRRLDEIIAFAEVDRFIDTPVKHYSSGMYMRLAFSVAAHMECDILIVDEVLAVGDIHFQKKCIGRIDSEVKSGKTVLFVSHNTSMIMQVCTRCILMENGRLVEDGLPQVIVESYLSREMTIVAERTWQPRDAPTTEERSFRLRAIRLRRSTGEVSSRFDVKEPIVVDMEWDVLVARFALNVHIYVRHESGVCVFLSMDNLDSPWRDTVAPVGRYAATCVIPAHFLNEGMFTVEFLICTAPTTTEYCSYPDAVTFYVIDDMRNEGVRGNWNREWFSSILRPRLQWKHASVAPLLAADGDDISMNQRATSIGG
ncbi:polysaccharide ABC transporter ATP-binding protein [Pseudorhodoplanes sp.]|uniref:ABC transporter ATP-binding protein n=1 Tax=Pseudorhodoplanes sp. TaxID=1934341 RepID=UPI003D103524